MKQLQLEEAKGLYVYILHMTSHYFGIARTNHRAPVDHTKNTNCDRPNNEWCGETRWMSSEFAIGFAATMNRRQYYYRYFDRKINFLYSVSSTNIYVAYG